jgi:mRNA interferase MazF
VIRRGDLRWLRPRRPDKRRPVLVLGRPSVLPSLSLIVVVPLSTTVRSLPWEVVLGEDDGVLARSALKVEWIRAVDRKLLGPRFATLPDGRWRAIRDALLLVLGLDDESLSEG